MLEDGGVSVNLNTEFEDKDKTEELTDMFTIFTMSTLPTICNTMWVTIFLHVGRQTKRDSLKDRN